MNARARLMLASALLLVACEDDSPVNHAATRDPWANFNIVFVETSMGDFEIELFRDEAPVSTGNFVRYVKDGFYDGLIIHRVIDNFMIQGGQFDENLEQKEATYPPIENEAGNGLQNLYGTIAMARTSDPQSAQCPVLHQYEGQRVPRPQGRHQTGVRLRGVRSREVGNGRGGCDRRRADGNEERVQRRSADDGLYREDDVSPG